MLIVIVAIAYFYLGGYAAKLSSMKAEADAMVKQSSTETFMQAQTSIVYDAKGRLVSKLRGEKDVYYLTSNEIPSTVKKAIISVEDKNFYRHNGVDYKAIVRAVYAMIQNKGEATQGASTITQQLARAIFLSQDKTWERKIEEVFVAMALENKYTKDQILEFYLNNIYFANGYYGIQAASKGYFNCGVDDLTLSQICFLLAIPNSPNHYDPLVNPQNTIARRNRILEDMRTEGYISEEVERRAKEEVIELNRPDSIKNNFVETYIYHCATRLLMEREGFEFQEEFTSEEEEAEYNQRYNSSYEKWNRALYTGGYRIYSSIDLTVQQQLQDAVDEKLAEFTELNEDGIYALQGAAVCIDNRSGMVYAIVGGRSQDVSGYTLNRGYQSYRQPGSSIKPLIVYTPALERGYRPDTKVLDEKIEDLPEDMEEIPEGQIDLRTAVKYSKNAVAWNLFQEIGPKTGLSYLKKMGFAKIVSTDEVPAAALGGLTYGVSPLEMAKAYATIENDGFMRDAGCIRRIEDGQGNQVYETYQEEVSIYDSTAARLMTDMLQSVIEDGTAKGISLGEMPCAGKTGTTNENRDGWFIGYTRYYTTSVWVGYDMPRQLPGLTGSSYPAAIWEQFMLKIHEGLTPMEFFKAVTFEEPKEEQEKYEEVTYYDEDGNAIDTEEIWVEDMSRFEN